MYLEIPQDSYCRAPATTVYLPIMMGNLSTDPFMLIRSVEVLDAKGQVVATERTAFKLESLAGKAGSSDAIRTALGIIPPAPADIATAQSLIAKAASTTDSKQKSILVEQAFFASRAKQSMKSPEELTADEAKIQQLLKPVALAVDLPQSTVDTTCETAVPVTVRITGELSGQPFTLDQQTMVYLLTSLPNGGMWHPGDGHVHTAGLAAPDSISQYTPGYEESYGYSDATDGASVLGRRNDANSKGMQWVVITDHAGDYSHSDQARLDQDEWDNTWDNVNHINRTVYKTACARATTQYSPTVTVCPGEELAVHEGVDLAGGHLLSYANSSYAASYGNGTCQSLINNVIGAGGFGIIAHPYNPLFRWSGWTATPWQGIEVVSNTATSWDDQAVSKCDQQLLARLTDELTDAISYRCVAMANSDVHSASGQPAWGSNMNYIYTGSYSVPGTSPSAVWNPIKQGSLTASSDGSFAAATVNGTYPGYKTTVPRNSSVSVFVTGTQVSSTYTTARVRSSAMAVSFCLHLTSTSLGAISPRATPSRFQKTATSVSKSPMEPIPAGWASALSTRCLSLSLVEGCVHHHVGRHKPIAASSCKDNEHDLCFPGTFPVPGKHESPTGRGRRSQNQESVHRE